MAHSIGRRTGVVVAVLVAGLAALVFAPSASAQTPSLRFTADCSGAATANAVDVPAGTTVNGVVVTVPTTVTTTNTPVIFPGGAVAIVNEVIPGPPTIRNAIRFIGGSNNGTIVGRVVCTATGATATALTGSAITVNCPTTGAVPPAGGAATAGNVSVGSPAGARCTSPGAATDGLYLVAAYPLTVDASQAAEAVSNLVTPSSGDGGPTTNVLLLAAAGALGLVVLGQVAIGRGMSRRRSEVTA